MGWLERVAIDGSCFRKYYALQGRGVPTKRGIKLPEAAGPLAGNFSQRPDQTSPDTLSPTYITVY